MSLHFIKLYIAPRIYSRHSILVMEHHISASNVDVHLGWYWVLHKSMLYIFDLFGMHPYIKQAHFLADQNCCNPILGGLYPIPCCRSVWNNPHSGTGLVGDGGPATPPKFISMVLAVAPVIFNFGISLNFFFAISSAICWALPL